MNNNIFLQMKKEKYNPDIENLLLNKQNDRDTTKFDFQKLIYNPITGLIPENVKTQNDLLLKKDTSLSDLEIRKLLNEKERERQQQNELYKPVKTKIITKGLEENKYNIKNNYLETYEQMKSNSIPLQVNNNNLNDIMQSMKELGILKE